MIKIMAFAGSARKDSFNKKLVAVAARGAEKAGASVTLVDLADYDMPIFNQDFEAEHGMPDAARRFKQLLIDHDGFLISSPEYNGAFSALLKNALDWASRAETEDESPLQAFNGKFSAIMSASPGGLGGLRGLVMLRMLLNNLGVTVIPQQQAVGQAFKMFDEKGGMTDERKQSAVEGLGKALSELVIKVKQS
ncbi:NAD(P)H-dependent oxidoreductase [Aliikangiella marina]|uniref:NAD(P)H-dependent oxidoreductase n=1 Tax=Aliikangiella marina TaxID=1712262 RepID=A0A545TE74_9GAMM|nr:NAD(P)H-dependent oxidoreductase [Aliikangiella marina]TQV75466.1 NAD(P)H-dependent oxidoreductase [Aliikangiella marina]